jgi:cytochrome c oxidase subunit I+III
MLFQFSLLTLALGLLVAGLLVFTGQNAGLARDYGPLPDGRGVSVPPHTEVAGAPPWLAPMFTLVADATLFTSLLFGTFCLWISAPNWPPATAPEPNLLLVLASFAALAIVLGCGRRCWTWP